jgi:hypothetical protein
LDANEGHPAGSHIGIFVIRYSLLDIGGQLPVVPYRFAES